MAAFKKELLKHQHAGLRRKQRITSIVKIMEAVQGSLVYSSFNLFKSWDARIGEGGFKLRGLVDMFRSKQCKAAFSNISKHAKEVSASKISERLGF